jgi:ABC-type nitrate/sulfonate/bicarbonate transport system ATPase subunit
LTGFDRAYPHQLSGGMAQRAALARGLAGRPDVLLLDEPFAALDALTRMEMQDLLIDVRQVARPTVLMVTHDVDEALYLADRVIVLGARPATVIAEVRVPLSRPRDRSDAAFSGPRATLLERVGVTHPTVSGHQENVRLSA